MIRLLEGCAQGQMSHLPVDFGLSPRRGLSCTLIAPHALRRRLHSVAAARLEENRDLLAFPAGPKMLRKTRGVKDAIDLQG